MSKTDKEAGRTLEQATAEARRIVNTWSVGAGAVGWIPGSMFLLTFYDAKLVGDVAKAFAVEHYTIDQLVAAAGATLTGKVIAGELLSLVPGLGWAVKSGVAAGVTKVAGEIVIDYFAQRSPLPRATPVPAVTAPAGQAALP